MLLRKLSQREHRIRFLKFLTVGGFAAAVQFGTLALFRHFISANFAFTLSFFASTGTHYVLNRFWALPSERTDATKQFSQYLISVGISYLINLACFNLFHGLAHIGLLLSMLLSIPPSTVVVFLLLNFWVFRTRTAE